MRNLQAIYSDKRGASCIRHFSSIDECTKFIKNVRRPCRVEDLDDNRRVIGIVEDKNSTYLAHEVGKNVRWIWWLEV